MKKNDKFVLGGLLVLIAIIAIWQFKPLTIVSLSQNVEIKQDQGDFKGVWWVAQFVINRPETITGVLYKDTQKTLSNGSTIKTGSEVSVDVVPYDAYTALSMTQDKYEYKAFGQITLYTTYFYRLNDPNTHTPFAVRASKNGQVIRDWQAFDIYYSANSKYSYKVTEGINLELLGTLGYGVSLPVAGQYVLYTDPYGKDHLYLWSEFSAAFNKFDSIVFGIPTVNYDVYVWDNVFSKLTDRNQWQNEYDKTQGWAKIYCIGGIIPTVTVWISSAIADTIYTTYPSGVAKILDYKATPTELAAGATGQIWVKVVNIGTTADTVRISIESNGYYSFSPPMYAPIMQPNVPQEFTFTVTSLATSDTTDRSIACNIMASSTSGSDTKTVYITHKGSSITPTPTLTPTATPTPTPSACYAKLGDFCLDFFLWIFLFALVIGIAYGYLRKGGNVGGSIIVSIIIACLFVLVAFGLALFMNALVSIPLIGGLFRPIADSVNSISANILMSVFSFALGMTVGTWIGDKVEGG